MPEGHGILNMVLDTAFLLGILITAVLTVFKAGRWFGKMIDSVDHLASSMDAFKVAFDTHTREEDLRFISVENKMSEHSRKIEELKTEVKKINKVLPGEVT